jgi:hypothetical protein
VIHARLLAALVAEVEGQREVYDADLAAEREADRVRKAQLIEPAETSAEERAVDGVAHHVFNTLRGHYDDINGVTFADVRAIVAESF